MSATPQALTGSTPAPYDFTTGMGQAYGTNPMVLVNPGVYAMWAGDANQSAVVTAADANIVFGLLNATGYDNADINLSGIISASDANIVFGNLNAASGVTRPVGLEITPATKRVSRPHEQTKSDTN
jgi:hypothetical protein